MMYMKHYISSTRHLSWFSNLVWPQRQPLWRLWPVALVARVAAPRCGSRIGQKPPESPRVPDDVQSDEVEHVHVSCNAGIMGYNIHIILKTPMTNKHWILERMHSSPENLVGYLIHRFGIWRGQVYMYTHIDPTGRFWLPNRTVWKP